MKNLYFLETIDVSFPRVPVSTQHLPGLWSISGSKTALEESEDNTVTELGLENLFNNLFSNIFGKSLK